MDSDDTISAECGQKYSAILLALPRACWATRNPPPAGKGGQGGRVNSPSFVLGSRASTPFNPVAHGQRFSGRSGLLENSPNEPAEAGTPTEGEPFSIKPDAPDYETENVLGYIMQVHCPCPGEEGQLDVTAVDHVKLIRNRPDLRFEGRIHEQLLPAIRRAGGDVAWTDIYVRHSGSDHSPDGWQRKLDRDLRILHRELEDTPKHPFVLFNLGMTYADAKRYSEAVGYLNQCITVSTPDQSHLRKAFSLLVSSLSQADCPDEAWQRCQQGLGLYADDKELLFRSAMLHHHFGRLKEAEETYLRVLNGQELRHFTSVDQGLAGFKARQNLAIVYEDAGALDSAEEQWRLITSQQSDYRPGWRGLGMALLKQHKLEAAIELASQLLARDGVLRTEGLSLRGRALAAQGNLAAAVADLKAADQREPAELEPLRALCQILFESGDDSAAEQALLDLTRRAPDDPAGYHNLGTLYQRIGRSQLAVTAFRRSLELRPDSAATRAQLEAVLQAAGGADDVKLSLCMIVRDNQTIIGSCLESIRPWVDEMIVVDTGSTDETPAMAVRLGARVFHFPWCDDFSAARNESLKHARGEWIFWMDSDDTISAADGEALRQLARSSHESNRLGYVMQVVCPHTSEEGHLDLASTGQVKLFRNHPGLCFERRIHEQILPSIRRARGQIGYSEIRIVHSGADYSPAGQRRKFERNVRLLNLELQDRPNDPEVYFYLGMTHLNAGAYEDAVGNLQHCLELESTGPTGLNLEKAYALLLSSLSHLDRIDEAWATCQRARQACPSDPELLFHEGLLAQRLGRLHEAEVAYLAALKENSAALLTFIDRGVIGFKSRHNLAMIYVARGRLEEAQTQWREIVRDTPDFLEAWRGLGQSLVQQRKFDDLRELLAHLPEGVRHRGLKATWEAELEKAAGNLDGARSLLETSVRRYPDDVDPLRAWCQLLFETAKPEQAEAGLRELIRRNPADVDAHANLGRIYLQMKRFASAADACRNALRFEPRSARMRVQLGCALAGLGRREEAVRSWNEALYYEPGNDAARRYIRLIQTQSGEQSLTPPQDFPAPREPAAARDTKQQG